MCLCKMQDSLGILCMRYLSGPIHVLFPGAGCMFCYRTLTEGDVLCLPCRFFYMQQLLCLPLVRWELDWDSQREKQREATGAFWRCVSVGIRASSRGVFASLPRTS